MKCLIVDDDEMARASLEHLCSKINELEIVAACNNGIEAMRLLKQEAIDLVFLDIEMPDLSGLDLVKTLDQLPQIIFVSGHTKYAIEAFEYHVTDFLVKPIDLPRLIKSIDHAQSLADKKEESHDLRELFVKVDGRLVRLSYDDILYVESIGDYVVFNTIKKEKFIVHSTLKNIDAKLQHPEFLKVHRAFVVNLTKIVDIEESNLVIGDKVVPISRAHKPILLKRIKTL
ncbi:MAG: LytTR family DNA-binding domain-containing protein [Cyclobacteriaceae bacterium]